MQKRFCDRCTREIPIEISTPDSFRYRITIGQVKDLSLAGGQATDIILEADLCKDCYREVREVLRTQRKGGA